MATKPKLFFQPVNKNLKPFGEPVRYWPLIVISGSETYQFALHRNIADPLSWTVSDPVSGGAVCHPGGQYRGIRVSSRGLSLAEIRPLALLDIEAMIAQVGYEKFNSVIAKARAGL